MRGDLLLSVFLGTICVTLAHSTDAEEDKGRSSASINPYHDPEFLKNRYMKPRPNNKPSSGTSLEALEHKAEKSKTRDEESLSKTASPKSREQTSTNDLM
ncbi:MAG: hypothetical protein H2057_00715 [Alphaproteobacteria bacterium]|nr:hypothetical protein [Alphaproteobacteria bacterium]